MGEESGLGGERGQEVGRTTIPTLKVLLVMDRSVGDSSEMAMKACRGGREVSPACRPPWLAEGAWGSGEGEREWLSSEGSSSEQEGWGWWQPW